MTDQQPTTQSFSLKTTWGDIKDSATFFFVVFVLLLFKRPKDTGGEISKKEMPSDRGLKNFNLKIEAVKKSPVPLWTHILEVISFTEEGMVKIPEDKAFILKLFQASVVDLLNIHKANKTISPYTHFKKALRVLGHIIKFETDEELQKKAVQQISELRKEILQYEEYDGYQQILDSIDTTTNNVPKVGSSV